MMSSGTNGCCFVASRSNRLSDQRAGSIAEGARSTWASDLRGFPAEATPSDDYLDCCRDAFVASTAHIHPGGWVEGPVPFRVRAGRLRRDSTDGRRSGREAAAGAALEQVRAASAQLEPAIADRCRADRGRVVVGCGKSCQDCRRLTGIDAKDEATGCLGVSHTSNWSGSS